MLPIVDMVIRLLLIHQCVSGVLLLVHMKLSALLECIYTVRSIIC